MEYNTFVFFIIFCSFYYYVFSMKTTSIVVEPKIQQKILYSSILSEGEKQSFLKYIAYLTPEETDELLAMI